VQVSAVAEIPPDIRHSDHGPEALTGQKHLLLFGPPEGIYAGQWSCGSVTNHEFGPLLRIAIHSRNLVPATSSDTRREVGQSEAPACADPLLCVW
jgi:hypothetical protein